MPMKMFSLKDKRTNLERETKRGRKPFLETKPITDRWTHCKREAELLKKGSITDEDRGKQADKCLSRQTSLKLSIEADELTNVHRGRKAPLET